MVYRRECDDAAFHAHRNGSLLVNIRDSLNVVEDPNPKYKVSTRAEITLRT
jgi:hypothetical protein